MTLIAEHGLAGASMGRIADAVGVSEPALYRHFENRRDMLLSVLNTVSSHLISLYIPEGDTITRFRRTSESFYSFVMDHPDDARVLFEFVCASPSEGLRENVQQTMLMILGMARAMLEEGIKQGELKADLETDTKAWEIFSLAFTLNFASLLSFSDYLPKEKAMSIIDSIITQIQK